MRESEQKARKSRGHHTCQREKVNKRHVKAEIVIRADEEKVSKKHVKVEIVIRADEGK